MAFSGTTYVNVAGATTAQAGQVVQSATWDNIHNDIGTALTQLMSQLTTMPTNRNIAWMNGGFEVWQHGAGNSASIAIAASTVQYTADRWYLATGVNQASTVVAVTGLNSQSSLAAKVGRNAGATGVTAMVFAYPFDSDEILRMRGKVLSLSFSIQAGANWSPTSGTLTVNLYVGTGAVAKRNVTPYTSETNPLNIATNLTPGGAVVAVSGNSTAIPSTATQAELQFSWTPTSNPAGAQDNFTIDDLQLEANLSVTTWTPTIYDRLDFPTMLQGCKRFYQKTFTYGVAPAQSSGVIQNSLVYNAVANQGANIYWQFPVECRVTASITTYHPTGATPNWHNALTGASVTASVDSTNSGGSKGVLIYGITATATTAANFPYYIHADASAGI